MNCKIKAKFLALIYFNCETCLPQYQQVLSLRIPDSALVSIATVQPTEFGRLVVLERRVELLRIRVYDLSKPSSASLQLEDQKF